MYAPRPVLVTGSHLEACGSACMTVYNHRAPNVAAVLSVLLRRWSSLSLVVRHTAPTLFVGATERTTREFQRNSHHSQTSYLAARVANPGFKLHGHTYSSDNAVSCPEEPSRRSASAALRSNVPYISVAWKSGLAFESRRSSRSFDAAFSWWSGGRVSMPSESTE